MVDMETVRFIDFLNRMAEKSRNGFLSFSEAKYSDAGNFIVYDDSNPNIALPDCYPVVAQAIIDSEHHDIVEYMSDHFHDDEISIYARYDSDSDDFYLYVIVPDESPDGSDFSEIIVEDGRWYVV